MKLDLKETKKLLKAGFTNVKFNPVSVKNRSGRKVIATGSLSGGFSTAASFHELMLSPHHNALLAYIDNVVVFDADSEDVACALKSVRLETALEVSTGRGVHHYYGCSNASDVCVGLDSVDKLDIIASPKGVFAPGSYHPVLDDVYKVKITYPDAQVYTAKQVINACVAVFDNRASTSRPSGVGTSRRREFAGFVRRLQRRLGWVPIRDNPYEIHGCCPLCGEGHDRFWVRNIEGVAVIGLRKPCGCSRSGAEVYVKLIGELYPFERRG